jgi:hypothetical protein
LRLGHGGLVGCVRGALASTGLPCGAGRLLHRVPGDDGADAGWCWGARFGSRGRAAPLTISLRSVGAVLMDHAISIWVPGLGGLIAWLSTRRARTIRCPAISPSWPRWIPLRAGKPRRTAERLRARSRARSLSARPGHGRGNCSSYLKAEPRSGPRWPVAGVQLRFAAGTVVVRWGYRWPVSGRSGHDASRRRVDSECALFGGARPDGFTTGQRRVRAV